MGSAQDHTGPEGPEASRGTTSRLARAFARRPASRRAGREEQQRAWRILQSAHDAFISIDSRGVVTDWNLRAEELLGWSRREALGRPLTELIVPPDRREAHEAGLARLARGEPPRILGQRTEMTARHRDGHEVSVELEVWRMEEDGEASFHAFLRDITERIKLEADLRTSRDKALASSRSTATYLATVSHEIRTPMNGVLGLTELLLDTLLDDTQRRYAEGIHNAGKVLLSLINDVLDLSKLEAGKVELEQVVFDPARLLDEVAQGFAQTAADKGLELSAESDPGLPPAVVGDPARLRQVLNNLTSNAVKFTSQGCVRLSAAPESPAQRDDTPLIPIRFQVTDTGIGISEQDSKRVFEPFGQADASTTRRFGGTGLGMAISRHLVEAMGGRIELASEPGAGSTFWCVIPLERTDQRVAPDAPAPDFDGLRVLIVDDTPTNRTVLIGQLGSWGMRPDALADASEALQALRDAADRGTPYDLAILDQNMPVVDGVDLARMITGNPHLGKPHLILLTSGCAPDRDTLRAAGIAATLTKPVHRSQLYDCLAGVLAPTPGAEQQRAEESPTTAEPAARSGHILLVEDNEINQTVAFGFLTRLGYSVGIAANGRQALSMASSTPYDAILMDCQMPIMDGYATTIELRRREGASRRTPVIAMTASALVDDRARCIAAGMDDYIAKPVDSGVLADVLARWIPADGQPTLSVAPTIPHVQPVFQIAERLAELRGPDPEQNNEVLARIAAMFNAQARDAITTLGTAIAARDAETVQAVAHRLKGAAGNLGATAMANLCQELETLARDRRLDHGPDLLNRLGTEYDLVREALQDVFQPKS